MSTTKEYMITRLDSAKTDLEAIERDELTYDRKVLHKLQGMILEIEEIVQKLRDEQ